MPYFRTRLTRNEWDTFDQAPFPAWRVGRYTPTRPENPAGGGTIHFDNGDLIAYSDPTRDRTNLYWKCPAGHLVGLRPPAVKDGRVQVQHLRVNSQPESASDSPTHWNAILCQHAILPGRLRYRIVGVEYQRRYPDIRARVAEVCDDPELGRIFNRTALRKMFPGENPVLFGEHTARPDGSKGALTLGHLVRGDTVWGGPSLAAMRERDAARLGLPDVFVGSVVNANGVKYEGRLKAVQHTGDAGPRGLYQGKTRHIADGFGFLQSADGSFTSMGWFARGLRHGMMCEKMANGNVLIREYAHDRRLGRTALSLRTCPRTVLTLLTRPRAITEADDPELFQFPLTMPNDQLPSVWQVRPSSLKPGHAPSDAPAPRWITRLLKRTFTSCWAAAVERDKRILKNNARDRLALSFNTPRAMHIATYFAKLEARKRQAIVDAAREAAAYYEPPRGPRCHSLGYREANHSFHATHRAHGRAHGSAHGTRKRSTSSNRTDGAASARSEEPASPDHDGREGRPPKKPRTRRRQ